MSATTETVSRELTGEQSAAIEWRGGSYLLSANAGSGKTTVIVERYLRLLLEDCLESDQILVITFTEKAAAELRERIRGRLIELGRPELALSVAAAPVSTIHGFCARLLRAESLRVGISPDFKVLDDYLVVQLKLEAAERAIERSGDSAVELLSRYGESALRRMIVTAYECLRTGGQSSPRLPESAIDSDSDEATAVLAHVDRLLVAFGEAYRERKEEHHGLDFADLELRTRDLLVANGELRERYRQQFSEIMVDEFQDTNPLQIELLELLARDNVFAVGDEFQSIYGFRGADVDVFRSWREQLRKRGGFGALTTNFRSGPELLDLINLVFSESFTAEGQGSEFMPLRAPAEVEGVVGPSVELLVTEHERWQVEDLEPSTADAGRPLWRVAEARLLARRVAELIESGECEPGEVAVLLRARRQMDLFERALSQLGVPTYLCGGSGFWSDRAVGDLIAALSVIANPLDELSLYEMLASPLVGTGSDTLALLARRARSEGVGVWQLFSEEQENLPQQMTPECLQRVKTVVTLAHSVRSGLPLSLAGLIERLVSATEFDLALLRSTDGRRAFANVRKLMRIAREFEAGNGSDLYAFVHFLRLAQDSPELAAGESVAPTEGEGIDAVRIMTIHQAKGLEFGVVCVADLGGRRNQTSEDLIVARDGTAVGLRLRDPSGGKGVPTEIHEELAGQLREAGLQEERRLFYVAMTRAQRRLILSGRRPERRAPMGWLAPAVVPTLERELERGEAGLTVEREFEGRKTSLRLFYSSPETVNDGVRLKPYPVTLPSRITPFISPDETQDQFQVAKIPTDLHLSPAPNVPDRLSYSALSSYQQCGYRFALERIVGLPRNTDDELLESGGDARRRGIEIHTLLERIDFRDPVLPQETPPQERELLTALLNSELATELAQATELSQEAPFMFVCEGLLIEGFIDLIAEVNGRTLVVDYKTDRLVESADLEAHIAERYEIQQTVYALALLEQGVEAVEIAYWFLDRPEQPVTQRYTQADITTLRTTLSTLIEPLRSGEFPVSPNPHAALCAGCPARKDLCEWDEAMTGRVTG